MVDLPSALFCLLLLSAHQVASNHQDGALITLDVPLNNEISDNPAAIPYNELIKLLILHQRDNRLRPIKSLQSRKNVKLLNGNYDFCFDPRQRGFDEKWHSKALWNSCSAGDFYRMPVPSAFNDILTNTSALNYMGWFWYQTNVPLFSLEQLLAENSRLFLQFESINYLALVYIQCLPSHESGSLVGSHIGGHLPLAIELDPKMLSGGKVDSIRITIAASNMLTDDSIPSGRMVDLSQIVGREYKQFQPDFDFFHYSGILGDVNLISLPDVYIETARPLYGSSNGLLDLEICVSRSKETEDNYALKLLHARHQVSYRIGGKNVTCRLSEQFEGMCCGVLEFSITDSSSLFGSSLGHNVMLQLDLMDQSAAIDRFELALREPGARHLDNLDLHGFGMHQEQFFSGRTMTLSAIMKDIYLLKQTGANVIRTSHYPYSPEYLDACDENGIMVIAECPAVGLKSFSGAKLMLHKEMLREMMWRDHHHPSIIMWSVANEPESQLPVATDYFQSLLDYAHNELAEFTVRARRPLTAAIAQAHDADKIGHLLDVIMVNRYYAWYDYTSALETIRPALLASLGGWAGKYPGKPLLISEFGADTMAGEHKATRGIYTEEFQRDLIVEHERVFRELIATRCNGSKTAINFIGSMIWNFADFTTHESLLRVGGVNRKGIFTRERQPKLAVDSVRQSYTARSLANNVVTSDYCRRSQEA